MNHRARIAKMTREKDKPHVVMLNGKWIAFRCMASPFHGPDDPLIMLSWGAKLWADDMNGRIEMVQ